MNLKILTTIRPPTHTHHHFHSLETQKSHKKKTFINFNKAQWKDFTYWTDSELRKHPPSDNIQQETNLITNTLIKADKHFIL